MQIQIVSFFLHISQSFILVAYHAFTSILQLIDTMAFGDRFVKVLYFNVKSNFYFIFSFILVKK